MKLEFLLENQYFTEMLEKILIVLYYNDINLTVRNCKLYKKLEDIIYYFPNKCLDIDAISFQFSTRFVLVLLGKPRGKFVSTKIFIKSEI